MAASIEAAVTELAALLSTDYPLGTPVATLRDAGVRKAYDHEPATVEKGCAVSASFAGTTPIDYRIPVRVYVADTAPRDAQRLLWEAVEAVDHVLAAGQHSGPSEWEAAFDPVSSVHYAESVQLVPRDTF